MEEQTGRGGGKERPRSTQRTSGTKQRSAAACVAVAGMRSPYSFPGPESPPLWGVSLKNAALLRVCRCVSWDIMFTLFVVTGRRIERLHMD